MVMLAFVTVNEGGANRQYFHLRATSRFLYYRPTSISYKFMFVVSSLIDLLGGDGQFTEVLGSGETAK